MCPAVSVKLGAYCEFRKVIWEEDSIDGKPED